MALTFERGLLSNKMVLIILLLLRPRRGIGVLIAVQLVAGAFVVQIVALGDGIVALRQINGVNARADSAVGDVRLNRLRLAHDGVALADNVAHLLDGVGAVLVVGIIREDRKEAESG